MSAVFLMCFIFILFSYEYIFTRSAVKISIAWNRCCVGPGYHVERFVERLRDFGSISSWMLTDSGFITTREYRMIYRESGFLASYDSAPPPPPPVSKLGCRHTGRLRKRDCLLVGVGGGVGSQIIRMPGPLKIIQDSLGLTLLIELYTLLKKTLKTLYCGKAFPHNNCAIDLLLIQGKKITIF